MEDGNRAAIRKRKYTTYLSAEQWESAGEQSSSSGVSGNCRRCLGDVEIYRES